MIQLLTSLAVVLVSQVRVEPEALERTYVGQRIAVEDLCSGVLGEGEQRHFRLKRCSNVKFIPKGVYLDNIQGHMVQVTGTVQLQDQNLVVFVDSLVKLPDDLTRYKQQADLIDENDFPSWYRLSDWALQRANNYQSEAMRERSEVAYRTAVGIQRRLAQGNPDRLHQLRDKIVQDRRITNYDLDSLDHEILRATYQQMQTAEPETLRQFARTVQQRLGGTPDLPPLAPAVREQYRQHPNAVFARANPTERARLSRYWQAEILNRALVEQARGKQWTTADLAKAAAEQFPDYPDLLKNWQDDALADFRRDPLTLSREQVAALAADVPELQRPQIYMTWLLAKEAQLQREEGIAEKKAAAQGVRNVRDAKARFELAELYQQWLPRNPPAVQRQKQLLTEAVQIDPSFMEAQVKLRQLGETTVATAPPRREAEAVGSAFRIGMRAEDITVAPDHKARFVTQGRTVHQWIYRGIGGKTTYLFLETGPSGALTVTDVRN